MASFFGSIFTSLNDPPLVSPGATGPWRPPQWHQRPSLTLTATDQTTGQQNVYVFDGSIRVEHDQKTVVTQNPVQTGASISDHVYVVPARLVIEIAMSDAMQSYIVGQWSDGTTRSISAYQTLIALEKAKNPVSVATPLRQYSNLIIETVSAVETKETTYALNATVTFTEILTATVQTTGLGGTANSSDPQNTNQTLIGNINGQPALPTMFLQNNIVSSPADLAAELNAVPAPAAAGGWCSTNISGIPGALGGG